MTYQIPRIAVNVKPAAPAPEPLYSLFRKVDGQWQRCRTTAYIAKYAMRVFGELVIANPHNFQLKRVDVESRAEGSTHFPRVHYKLSKEFTQSHYQELTNTFTRK